MNSSLAIETQSRDNVLIVSLKGMLDGHTTPDLETFIHGDLVAEHPHMILNLAELSYVASAGIGVFIGAQQEAKNRGGSVGLVRPSAAVAEVFNLLGLQALFSIHPSIEAALAAAQA